jgi:hypothetical protein
MKTTQALRSAIQRQRTLGRTKVARYSSQLKAAVAEHVRFRRAAGASFEALSSELGLPVNTLRRWLTPTGRRSKLVSLPNSHFGADWVSPPTACQRAHASLFDADDPLPVDLRREGPFDGADSGTVFITSCRRDRASRPRSPWTSTT